MVNAMEVDRMVSLHTERLYDSHHGRGDEHFLCELCKNYYIDSWDEVSVSKLDDRYEFCSEGCRDKWDEENKHDYEDER